MQERFGYLDGWRGIAICLVLMGHFFDVPGINEPRLGVDVFFVLSGLLMSKILYEQRMPLGQFYWRRFTRIFPALLFYLFFVFAFQGVFNWTFPAIDLGSTLLFARTYFPEFPDIWNTGAPIGHLWSLNVEEHSYLIMSLLTIPLFLRKREWVVLVLLCGATTLVMRYNLQHFAPNTVRIRTECASFFVFCSAAYFLIKPHLPWKMPVIFTPLAMAAVVYCYMDIAPWWLVYFRGVFLAYVVNHLVDLPQFGKRILEFKPLRMMGIFSFSVYLWQQPFYEFQVQHHNFVLSVVSLVAAISVGVASFYFIESPARRMLNSMGKPRPALAPGAVSG